MLKPTIIIIVLLISKSTFAQIANNYFFSKEYSKEISLYRAKEYVMNNVLGISSNAIKFEIDALVASNSGELTSLVYKCEDKKKEGLLLGFYGAYWNESGVIFQGYKFKDFNKNQAIDIFNKIDKIINEDVKFLKKKLNHNNVYFEYDDLTFLIYAFNSTSYKIRVFWGAFDSEWLDHEYERTRNKLIGTLD